ncbi:MAG: formylmethanofuran--tetrahydromethanopterin N-formyltransferase [Burkholderiales bacterium]
MQTASMIRNGVSIDDTFAEAFGMKATRIVITAINLEWAYHAARAATGFATSVIGCGCEAGIEADLSPDETPDGRPGVSILLFAVSTKELAKQVDRRTGQCVLTSPTSACYSGIDGESIPLGKNLRFFGDGYQNSKVIGGRRYWRVPVMDGEFLCEETTGMVKAVGGGNFLILAKSTEQALHASEGAIAAMRKLRGVIMPFPGGVVRSGSKVGSKYKALIASTNDAYCPTLRGASPSTQLTADVGAVLEIVIDGLTDAHVRQAMRVGMQAVCEVGIQGGVLRISAGNYGGKLGPYHYPLREILE